MTDQVWLRDYAMLALLIDRLIAAPSGGAVLIYRGPDEWRTQAGAQSPPRPGRLAEEADRLLDALASEQAPYLVAQIRAMRAVARYLDGERLPLAEYAQQCLGLRPRPLPESVFEEAHELLDAALPKTRGSLAERLRAWQRTHTLTRMERLPDLVGRAVAETRARTETIVTLPADESVGCQVVGGVSYHAAGHHHGGTESTIFINGDLPFNLADLLYIVAHEGHPGHIAESLLKERLLVDGQGRADQRVRFMLSPSFLISEGLGLCAQEILFPGDEAQTWLAGAVLPEFGIRRDGSDLAAIHHAKNVLWGVWGNAAFLAAEGSSDARLGDYLARWALYDESEIARTLNLLRPSVMSPYIFGYVHGWRLVRRWLDAPDRRARVRRLLTEQLLPADLGRNDDGGDIASESG
ncbi:hypothetical protein ACFQVD_18260 [Streptosporangium amethystogenes subsp. fukuiense]|uniref:DUF885 domain-containing protein n=1 Tax=Streptosporangium amethystogenes subsp. fukuiense TaxID=698418 RepID=A0ABW2T175_9ACTN